MRCVDCSAFRKADGAPRGSCHLSPPTPVLAGINPPRLAGGQPTPVTVSLRPLVADDDFCMMFTPLAQHEVAHVMNIADRATKPKLAHVRVKGVLGWYCVTCGVMGEHELETTDCRGA